MGYFFETSKQNAHRLPDHFIKKQTLTNVTRFTTAKLIDLEGQWQQQNAIVDQKEKSLLESRVERVVYCSKYIRELASLIAKLDIELGFADLSVEGGYCKPNLSDKNELHIVNMRHPIIEKTLMGAGKTFVPNSLRIGSSVSSSHVHIITGPNMAGKSTFLRQTALLVIMAHLGCYVPAKSAVIPEVDRVFTRVGASDRLARGESTFLVEMKETASILKNSTERSLVIMDEIGRGTSTRDGLAIASAIVDFLATRDKSTKTLFATHYHELTVLENQYGDRVENFHISLSDEGEKIVFLNKITKGSTNRSYGVHVAEIAGLPKSVTNQASKILARLEKADLNSIIQDVLKDGQKKKTNDPEIAKTGDNENDEGSVGPELHDKRNGSEEKERRLEAEKKYEELERRIRAYRKKLASIDLEYTTPMQALQLLEELKKNTEE